MKRPFLPSFALSHRLALRPLLGLVIALGTAMGLSACVDPDHPVARDNSAMLAPSDRVSSVPWNKPQGWENQSQLGSLANDPRVGGPSAGGVGNGAGFGQ